jgi:hypothetical protein
MDVLSLSAPFRNQNEAEIVLFDFKGDFSVRGGDFRARFEVLIQFKGWEVVRSEKDTH